ncbi:MAG: hypothetical protein AB8B48_17500 [Pseudomonadales bacterium]
MTTPGLDSYSREQLARIGREYMLLGQLNSRTGYAALAMNHGQEAYKETAIHNWMAASPVYSKRMQSAMRLNTKSDVEAILKGMQLECGLSHQYFDAHFEMTGDDEGVFWLDRCGPLLDTEPRGEAAVKVMCHDIEDPTFDATAAAGNPRARVRPVHRPPRVPTDGSPVCRWRVFIDPEAEPLGVPDVALPVIETRLANTPIDRNDMDESDGLDYYDGELFEKLELERFSRQALLVICKELGIQIHLLIHTLGLAVASRYGQAAVADITAFQMTGSCWVASERLASCLELTDGGIDAVVDVVNVHPAFQPQEYSVVNIQKTSPDSAVLTLKHCAAQDDTNVLGWFNLLMSGRDEGLVALIQGVDNRAIVTATANPLEWQITISSDTKPAEPPPAVHVAKGTPLYTFKLENHIELLDITS